MEYILITSENKEAFASVLPEMAFAGQQTLAIGAYHEGGGLVCGAVCLTQTMEDYQMDWLYVLPAMRRRGIASDLLREANALVEETGLMPVVCQIPVEITDDGDATEDTEDSGASQLLHFFEALGDDHLAVDVTLSHTRFITDAKDFYTSGDLRAAGAVTGKTPLRFFNQSEIYKRAAFRLIEEHFSILDKEAFEASCIPPLCLTIENGGVPTSLMLTQKKGDYIVLSFLYGKTPRELFAILCAAAEEVRTNYPDARIVFDIVNTSAMALSERFFSKADRFQIYEAEW